MIRCEQSTAQKRVNKHPIPARLDLQHFTAEYPKGNQQRRLCRIDGYTAFNGRDGWIKDHKYMHNGLDQGAVGETICK